MKLFLKIFTLLSVFGVTGLKAQTALRVEGTVNNVKSGKVYLQKFNNKMFFPVDTALVVDGKFSFKSSVQLPEVYGISMNPEKGNLYVFLEDKPITIQLDTNFYMKNSVVKGSALQELFNTYRSTENLDILSFVKKNPSSLVSAYVLYKDWSYRLSPEQIEENVNALDTALAQTSYVKGLKALVPVLKTVQKGNRALDFTSTDVNGKPVKFSDHLGKYVLLEFWASWCPSCREENPNVVNAYKKYKNKGFDVFGVSLDKDKTSWINAINNDGLTWTQVSDLAYWNSGAAKLYGVREIPANVLIDPNGIIIARNLYADELDKKLEEIFGTEWSK